MNCLLQTLFHNERFRQAIYDCSFDGKSKSDASEVERAVIAELQKIFTSMQTSLKRKEDLSYLAHLLRINSEVCNSVLSSPPKKGALCRRDDHPECYRKVFMIVLIGSINF